jgi:TRAP-type C4-dicarboxylate transport system permease small subunit|tara:strand:- start:2982 stop:3539 length:558 start_codon:yes stop_codon:yes gene_type:complete
MGSTVKDFEASKKIGFSRAFELWVLSLNNIGTIWIFVLMVIINADVFSRFLFNAPINGVPEMVALSIVGIVFLQLGEAVRAGRLTRSDGFFNKVVEKRPKLGLVLNTFYDLCGMAFFIAILFGAISIFIESYQGGYYVGTEGIFIISEWPIRLILVISCITVVAVFLSLVKRHISALINSGATDQ